MAHLPRHPVGTQTCGLGDLPELAKHVVTIKGRADSRSEDKTVIFPENASQQPVIGLAVQMRTERPYSQLRQRQRGRLFGVFVSAVARTAR
jgi:hypothetical protein